MNLRDLFLLDPTVVFLNHGSYGACPRPVFAVYQEWQRRLERQPVLFLGRELRGLDRTAREAVAAYLGAAAGNLVFVPNATFGVNAVARSLKLGPGDEILTSNHEYGACDKTWDFVCRQTGALVRRQAVALPVQSAEQIAAALWAGVTERTRVIYISHITSSTALRFPIERICARAREQGILTVIDGAHAPGQIPLHLEAIGADFYVGNLHKWALAPKGAAFLYARPASQSLLQPLIVSWGYQAAADYTTGSPFLDNFRWTGTRDPAAVLSAPAAIRFMDEYGWAAVRPACHDLLRQAIARICALVGMAPLCPLDSDLYGQMGVAPLPPAVDGLLLKGRLYDEYRVEVPIIMWEGQPLLRISVQGYNTSEDIAALLEALEKLLPELCSP